MVDLHRNTVLEELCVSERETQFARILIGRKRLDIKEVNYFERTGCVYHVY